MDKMIKGGRIPPYDFEAEQAVLGSMLLEKSTINIATQLLQPEDFFDDRHIEIYDVIKQMSALNIPIDHISLSDELKKRGKLEFTGGVIYLMEVTEAVVITSNIEQYCKIVKDKAILRRLINVGDNMIGKSFSQKAVKDILSYAESEIYDITQGKYKSGLKPINKISWETLQYLEMMYKRRQALTGITTGFKSLDKKLLGLQNSELILLAARPSMGKTALGINMAVEAAKSGNVVAIFSLEMSDHQLIQRMLSSISLVELRQIITGEIEDWTQVINAISILSDLNIYIDDTAGISITEMRSKCRRLQSEKGLNLIVVDYLQLMTGDSKNENRQQEISSISRGLKALAKEMRCPILALSQLSRKAESREDKKPALSDLRESGAIEQDADVVMLLYREDYYKPDTERANIADVIIAKHRNGPTGSVELFFNKEYTKFQDLMSDIEKKRYEVE